MDSQRDNQKEDAQREGDVFYETVAGSPAAATLFGTPKAAGVQSCLFCSKDTDALLLLIRFLIKSENGGKENSADIVYFSGDKILTADVEKITSTANLTPLELEYRYFILKNGQTMTDPAANKLLKTLEEPPPKIKIFILADDEYSVLPTVKSRCRTVTLPPFCRSVICLAADKAYGGREAADLKRIKSLALGSLTRLKKAAAGEYDDTENTVFACLSGMKTSADVVRYSQLLGKLKGGLSEAIDFFELVFGDVLRLYGKDTPLLSYRREELEEIARFYRAETVIRLRPVLARARTRLKFSGNAASVIDELLFSLLEIRARCKK